MALSHDDELEDAVLTRLYEFAQDHPTAYKRLRIDNDRFDEDDVGELLDALFDRNFLSGNVEERNVQLTSDGIDFIEENYPDIAEAGR